jgi:hypothetical protein
MTIGYFEYIALAISYFATIMHFAFERYYDHHFTAISLDLAYTHTNLIAAQAAFTPHRYWFYFNFKFSSFSLRRIRLPNQTRRLLSFLRCSLLLVAFYRYRAYYCYLRQNLPYYHNCCHALMKAAIYIIYFRILVLATSGQTTQLISLRLFSQWWYFFDFCRLYFASFFIYWLHTCRQTHATIKCFEQISRSRYR